MSTSVTSKLLGLIALTAVLAACTAAPPDDEIPLPRPTGTIEAGAATDVVRIEVDAVNIDLLSAEGGVLGTYWYSEDPAPVIDRFTEVLGSEPAVDGPRHDWGGIWIETDAPGAGWHVWVWSADQAGVALGAGGVRVGSTADEVHAADPAATGSPAEGGMDFLRNLDGVVHANFTDEALEVTDAVTSFAAPTRPVSAD